MSAFAEGDVAPEVAAAAAEWFARLQEHDSSEQDFQRWQAWLRASTEHQRAFRQVERAWNLMGDVTPVPWASPRELQQSASRSRRTQIVWAAAASTVLAIGALFAWPHLRADGPTPFATAIAEQRSMRLPDGSRVILGAKSRIRPLFSSDARRVVLEYGEAFFDVAQDPLRPFTVLARGNEIRAIGTAFNVRATSDAVLVSVTEGRIAVVPRAEAAATRRERSPGETTVPGLIVSSGQQAVLDPAGKMDRQQKPAEEIATWRLGRFEYRGESLREVVEDLNRYTEHPIELEDESVAALRYSGTVFPDHLDEWLDGISGVLPVVVSEDGVGRRIARAR